MTTDQLQTRIKWFLKDLKESYVIAEDTTLDTRLFAVRSAKHVFELLWRLVCHDIYFLWERIDFLTENNEETLIKVPFNVRKKNFLIYENWKIFKIQNEL